MSNDARDIDVTDGSERSTPEAGDRGELDGAAVAGVRRREIFRAAMWGAASLGAIGTTAGGAGAAAAEVAPAGSIHYRLESIRLPANKVEWAVHPSRAVLLVHDMQLYFTRVFHPSTRNELLTNIAVVRKWCDRNGVPVCYSAQRGGASRSERGLMFDFAGMGMSAAPRDRSIEPRVAPRPGETVLVKHKLSEYFHSDLLALLHRLGRDQLIIVGVYADTGVLLTAADSVQNDVQSFVVANSVADQTPEGHGRALEWIASRAGYVMSSHGLHG